MDYIIRNDEFDNDNYKAYEIYSDSTCKHLKFTCNYDDMIKVIQDNIDIMLDNKLIDYQEAWFIKDDHFAYDVIVDSLEDESC